MSKWLRKDDTVKVIAGNDKGKTGKVLRKINNRVLVQGINIRKKHVKRTSENTTAQIVDIEAPLHISNVRIVGKNGNPIRLKVKVEGKDKKLVYTEDGKEMEFRKV